jgi:hypothetical protein
MTNPLLTSLDELSKVLFLAMRFIDGDDIDEFNQELDKLGIKEGFGARAKKAMEEAANQPPGFIEFCQFCRKRIGQCKCQIVGGGNVSSLTPREIKMAKFLATECLEAATLAASTLDLTMMGNLDNRQMRNAYERIKGVAHFIRSANGPIADFTEEEARIIRESK